ncbi:hypothetical protein TNCV_2776751 [Trichonephila clavipes]|nr:hypothetical protein TNCV_2776751 [Trichonephila clavipes]
MEEEGSDDETQCDKKDVVPHADGAAALDLRYLEQQPDTTPDDVLLMRRWSPQVGFKPTTFGLEGPTRYPLRYGDTT